MRIDSLFPIAFSVTAILLIVQYLLYIKLRERRAVEKQKEKSQKQSLRPEIEEQKKQIQPEEKKDWFELCIEGKYENAIKMLEGERDSAEGEKKLDKSVDMAFANYLWGKKEEAFNILRKLIDQYPHYTDSYYYLGKFYNWSHMMKESIDILDRGITAVKEEEKPKLVLVLASIYRDIKDKEKIEQSITRLNSFTKKNADIFLEIARLYNSIEKDNEAILYYTRAIEIEPANVKNLLEFAEYLYDKNKKIEALKEYKKIISLDPKNYSAYGMIGNIYLELELNNKALEMYEKAHSLYPEGAWIIANIGNLYKNRGFYNKAKEYLEKALKINPEDDYAHDRLSSTLKFIEKENDKEKEILQKKEKEEQKIES